MLTSADARVENITHSRGLERVWHLDDITKVEYGDIIHSSLSLYVYHVKDRKAFRVSFNRVAVGPRFHTIAITFGVGHPVKDYLIPVARYSDKALQLAFADAIEENEAYMPKLLDWARGAIEEV